MSEMSERRVAARDEDLCVLHGIKVRNARVDVSRSEVS
jgi:hypothetical protein